MNKKVANNIDNETVSAAKVSDFIFSHIEENLSYPIIPLRNMVAHPKLIVSLFVGRAQSIKIINANENKLLLFLLQKDPKEDNPAEEDFYSVGTVAKILHVAKMPDKTLKITIEGQFVGLINHIEHNPIGFYQAQLTPLKQIYNDEVGLDANKQNLKNAFTEYLHLKKQYSPELIDNMNDIQDPFTLIDFVTIHTEIDCVKKQELLEQTELAKRFEFLHELLEYEIGTIKLSEKISQDVKKRFEEQHKRILLTTKLDATRKALESLDGEESIENEIDNLKDKIKAIALTPEAKEKAEKELLKLKTMNSMSSEATVIRNYLDWLLGLPWGQSRTVNYDLAHAKQELEKNHAGLKKIKDRIYEMIAVEARVGTVKAPILCFYGPPGVGKTSLARSIASATDREFISISLGGLHDEAEIRGHRSTYIGAKPGKIIQGIKRAKSDNPVFLLDEIGEIGQDMRSNPAAAFLEILDPEHRHEFRDNFLEVAWPFDKAMIIASTNRLDTLPPALVDRMEIIPLSGYTKEEKLAICLQHLVAKQIKNNGLNEEDIQFPEQTIKNIIEHYTREAGVRDLERKLAQICRKVIVQLDVKPDIIKPVVITQDVLEKYLGAPPYADNKSDLFNKIGVASGLAWTSVGGEILFIEAITTKGDGKVTITGKLGDVMKESVHAAWSVVKSKAIEYNIDSEALEKTNLHVHVPEGATPKDGPSAGVALCVAIMSAITKRAAKGTIAMTGEINLQGKILKIGGLKEKLLAAVENKISTVFIPQSNKYELEEIKLEANLEALEIVPVGDVDVVLKAVLS